MGGQEKKAADGLDKHITMYYYILRKGGIYEKNIIKYTS